MSLIIGRGHVVEHRVRTNVGTRKMHPLHLASESGFWYCSIFVFPLGIAPHASQYPCEFTEFTS